MSYEEDLSIYFRKFCFVLPLIYVIDFLCYREFCLYICGLHLRFVFLDLSVFIYRERDLLLVLKIGYKILGLSSW